MYKKEIPETASHHHKRGRGPYRLYREHGPADTVVLVFSFQSHETIHAYGFKLPNLLVIAALGS